MHVGRDSRWFAGGIDRTRRVWSEPVRHSNDAGSSTTAVAVTTIADHGRDVDTNPVAVFACPIAVPGGNMS